MSTYDAWKTTKPAEPRPCPVCDDVRFDEHGDCISCALLCPECGARERENLDVNMCEECFLSTTVTSE